MLAIVTCVLIVIVFTVWIYLALHSLDERLWALHDRLDEFYDNLNMLADAVIELSEPIEPPSAQEFKDTPSQSWEPTVTNTDDELLMVYNEDWDDDELPLTEEAEDEACTGPNCPQLPEHMRNQVPHNAHAIICGASGSGKTVVAKALLMDRIIAGQQIYLVDTKRELGTIFGPYCAQVTHIDGATKMVKMILAEADRRQDLFESYMKANRKVIANLADYNRHSGQNLPTITLVLEELIRLTTELDTEFIELFLRLIAVSRSAGIFILTTSQYLNISILPKAASTNFMVKIYLGKFDKTLCNQVLFSQPLTRDEAASLGPVGYGIVEINGDRSAKQFANVPDSMLEEWL